MIKATFLCVACLALSTLSVAQNRVGINNNDPKAALDINGGLRLRPITSLVAGTSVILVSNHGYHFIGGTPTGNFTITLSPLPSEGQHTIITNTTVFTGNVFSIAIPAATTVELFFSNGEWQQIGSSQTTAAGWGLNGNSGTNTNNYIGTTDAQPIRFRTHGNRNVALLDNAKFNYHIGGGLPNSASYIGTGNVSLGYLSSGAFTSASDNVAIGQSTLKNTTSGGSNVAIGLAAMEFNKTGVGNIAIGTTALYRDTSGLANIAIGTNALFSNIDRGGNVAIGYNALYYNCRTTTSPIAANEGSANTAIGAWSLYNNRRGSGAVAIGFNAAFSDTAAHGMVAIGRFALFNNNGIEGNIAIGDSALFSNGIAATLINHAAKNIAIGSKALLKNFIGDNNTAVGYHAMQLNQTGSSNSAFGSNTLATSKGFDNTAVGANALSMNETGTGNTALGSSALQNLRSAASFNVAIGISALQSNQSGSGNVAIGRSAGKNEIGSDKLYIENSANDKTNALIYGDFAADSLLLNAKTINKFSLNVRGNYPLEIGYGTAGKQTDAGKLCYGCFGDPIHWLGIVGGGTAANGSDRVIKLWSEGGLRIRGDVLPNSDNNYTLGQSGQRWSSVWSVNGVTSTSDANLKTNITTSPYGLNEVLQMNPVQYNWKTNPTEDSQIGFLAQDIQKIIPEAVVVPANGDPLGMKYTELIPVLVKAIQEQQKRIDELEKKVKRLQK